MNLALGFEMIENGAINGKYIDCVRLNALNYDVEFEKREGGFSRLEMFYVKGFWFYQYAVASRQSEHKEGVLHISGAKPTKKLWHNDAKPS